ncbi:MAG TPA: hypothetical protein VF427_12250 [Noviherbaspirillum sp.]
MSSEIKRRCAVGKGSCYAVAGQIKVWGIVARGLRIQIGTIVSRNSIEGIDVEVLVASQFWDDGVVEDASEPVMDWLDDNADVLQNFPISMHCLLAARGA